jgi:hypothetical protein
LEQPKALEFMGDRKNIIMYSRTEKTSSLQRSAQKPTGRRQHRVKFCRSASLVNQLSEAKSADKLSAFLKKLKSQI